MEFLQLVGRQPRVITRAISLAISLSCAACGSRADFPPVTDVTWGRGVCDSIQGSGRCSEAIQNMKLVAADGLVSVSEDSICFSGRAWTGCVSRMMGDPSFPGTARYIGTYGSAPYHVLWIGYYEGSSVSLIHTQTGAIIEVDAVPVVSPDGSRLAVASGDLAVQYNPNRLSVWRYESSSLLREWSVEPDQWEPRSVEWVSNLALRVERAWPSARYRIDTVMVVLEGGEWHLPR